MARRVVEVRKHGRRGGTIRVKRHHRGRPINMKVHSTDDYERWRIKDPKAFKKGSFRTQDIGRKGLSKRVAGRLKKTGKWQTQAILISHDEPSSRKQKLRAQATAARARMFFPSEKPRGRAGFFPTEKPKSKRKLFFR